MTPVRVLVNPPAPEALLSPLLEASDEHARRSAWSAFLEEYSALILHVARARNRDHDALMNCYEYVLDHLQRDDLARLRRFSRDAQCKFTTWLIVVVRRLCVDCHRQRYGRQQAVEASDDHVQRRRLTDLVSDAVALEAVADTGSTDTPF